MCYGMGCPFEDTNTGECQGPITGHYPCEDNDTESRECEPEDTEMIEFFMRRYANAD